MRHLIEHDLDLPTARQVIERAFAEYQTRYASYEPSMRWLSERRAGFSFQARGLRLAGSVELLERAFALELEVPFLLRLFQRQAILTVEREAQRWLERARAGQL